MQDENEMFIPVALVKAFVSTCCDGCQRRMAQQLLGMQARPLPRAIGPLHELLSDVAKKHGLSVDDLRRHSNMAHLVAARREFAQRAREQGCSLPRIGMFIDRHHTTVLNLLQP